MFVPGACVLQQFARTIEWEIDDGRVWQVIYVTVFVTKILPQTNVVVTSWITMKCDQRHVIFWRLKAGASFDQFRRLMTPTAKCILCPSLLPNLGSSTKLATTTPPQCGVINCFPLIITFSLFCKRAALMLNEIQARAELSKSDRITFWITAKVTWSNGQTFWALVGYCGSTVWLLLRNCHGGGKNVEEKTCCPISPVTQKWKENRGHCVKCRQPATSESLQTNTTRSPIGMFKSMTKHVTKPLCRQWQTSFVNPWCLSAGWQGHLAPWLTIIGTTTLQPSFWGATSFSLAMTQLVIWPDHSGLAVTRLAV